MVGAGISELNPAVSEELTRLRGDNDSLKRQVQEQSAENLRQVSEEGSCEKRNDEYLGDRLRSLRPKPR